MVLYVHGNPIRLIRDGRREVSGEERDYKKNIPIATLSVTTRMTSALRWAAMRAILKFH